MIEKATVARNSLKYVSIYVTASNLEEAERIGEAVVKKRLAACANIVERISSIYWWKGKLERSDETLLFLKSRREKAKEVIKAVRKLHSYENPAIVVFPIVDGSKDYLDWLDSEIK